MKNRKKKDGTENVISLNSQYKDMFMKRIKESSIQERIHQGVLLSLVFSLNLLFIQHL